LRKIKTAEEGRKMKARRANVFEFGESNLLAYPSYLWPSIGFI